MEAFGGRLVARSADRVCYPSPKAPSLTCGHTAPATSLSSPLPPFGVAGACTSTAASPVVASASDANLLVRAALGEETERTPVWLMRQAGRYMSAFRAYSDKYPFRMRSETPEIATELSLQCWRAFDIDGVFKYGREWAEAGLSSLRKADRKSVV